MYSRSSFVRLLGITQDLPLLSQGTKLYTWRRFVICFPQDRLERQELWKRLKARARPTGGTGSRRRRRLANKLRLQDAWELLLGVRAGTVWQRGDATKYVRKHNPFIKNNANHLGKWGGWQRTWGARDGCDRCAQD